MDEEPPVKGPLNPTLMGSAARACNVNARIAANATVDVKLFILSSHGSAEFDPLVLVYKQELRNRVRVNPRMR
jgi:hypothetical protein